MVQIKVIKLIINIEKGLIELCPSHIKSLYVYSLLEIHLQLLHHHIYPIQCSYLKYLIKI